MLAIVVGVEMCAVSFWIYCAAQVVGWPGALIAGAAHWWLMRSIRQGAES